MLTILWLFLSTFLGLFQLFFALQPEWIVNATTVQGLWLICFDAKCQIRKSIFPLLVMSSHVTGILLLLLSTVLALSVLAVSTTKRKSLTSIANTQFAAVLFMGISVCCIPLSMEDINCTRTMLLHSNQCRIGWAYASACVLSLVSVCCPVLARLVVDQNKQYYTLSAEQLL